MCFLSKGFAADIKKNKRSEAWGAILGTAAAVAFVGLVVYVILKKRRQREFTHRKLVEEFPPDPGTPAILPVLP